MAIHLELLQSVEQMQQISHLERRVWGMEPMPLHHTITAVNNGGIAIGAYEGSKMVGFVYSFAGFSGGRAYLCSHMMGIDPDYRDQGIGYQLKMKQAEEARKIGYDLIRWTYDPLESRNAYLNITKLGAICSDYLENFYGEMTDQINQGLPSDRLHVEWWINRPYLAQRETWFPGLQVQKENLLLGWERGRKGEPHPVPLTPKEGSESAVFFLPIPVNYHPLKRQDLSLVREWRLQTREALQKAFARGLTLVHVLRIAEEPVEYYVLVPRERLPL